MLKKIINYIKIKKIKLKNCDSDFWGIIYNTDLDNEEVDNNVRYCFTIYEPIN